MDQTEKDVLGSDVVVVEEPRLFLGEDDHPAGPVSESLEQWALLPIFSSGSRLDLSPDGRASEHTRPRRLFSIRRRTSATPAPPQSVQSLERPTEEKRSLETSSARQGLFISELQWTGSRAGLLTPKR